VRTSSLLACFLPRQFGASNVEFAPAACLVAGFGRGVLSCPEPGALRASLPNTMALSRLCAALKCPKLFLMRATGARASAAEGFRRSG
jgi:hypothetical protein